MPSVESLRKSEVTLGRRIASARALLGLNQLELAKHIGVSANAISMYEKDQRSPKPEMLSALSRALDVSVDWLLHGESAAA